MHGAGSGGISRLVPALALALLVAVAFGCAAMAATDPPDRAAATARIAAADARLAFLDRFEATGTAVLPMRSASGAIEEEQLDLLLLRERPGRLAVRLKLSVTDTLAWLGSDGVRWWLFLPADTPPTVWHGAVSSVGEEALEGDAIPLPPGMRQPKLVDLLLGLEPVGDLAMLQWDPATSTWWIERSIGPEDPDGLAWTVRRGYFEGDTGASPVPTIVEILDGAGVLRARSRLSEHARVEVPDRAVGDWPLVPMRIELSGGDAAEAPARIALERPSGRGARVKAAAFDWNRLLQAMRPERLVEVGTGP